MMTPSPYIQIPEEKWIDVTKNLIKKHPLSIALIRDTVLSSWNIILTAKLGRYQIGKNIFPKPQIMGFFLHELIPLEISAKIFGWKKDDIDSEKDLVCIADSTFSIEIKTSSSDGKIYGNRSYSQKTTKSKKDKSGYYLAINFEKFTSSNKNPKITKIRFGWLDHEDWTGQAAQTGQQASLSKQVEQFKLLEIYPQNNTGI